MPTAFSAQEKSRITDLLLENGQNLFATQGLRKTSLDELVAPAGIAKSSFYLFFDSKEALYLELMARRSAEVKRRVIDGALLKGADARDGLRHFLHATLKELTTDPLWQRLMTHPEEMQAVARKVSPEAMAAMTDSPATALLEYATQGRASGELVDRDAEVIVGVLQCVLMVPTLTQYLADPSRAPEVTNLLVDIVATGLTT